jgi:hypothetical protein
MNNIMPRSISKLVRNTTYNLVDGGRAQTIETVYAFGMGSTGVDVRKITLSDSDATGVIVTTQTVESFSIDARSWGYYLGSMVVADVMYNSTVGAFVLLLKSAAASIILSWSPSGLNWVTRVTSLPPFFSVGARAHDYPATEYIWIGEDQIVYYISLLTGVVTRVGAAPVPVVGAQYYNPAEGSILYISNLGSSQLTKYFISHVAASPQPLSDVITDMLLNAGLRREEIDMTALSAVNVDGYKINVTGPVVDAIGQLSEAYGIRVFEQGGRIAAAVRGTGAPIVVTADDYSGDVAFEAQDVFGQLLSASITYISRARGYAEATQNMRKTQYLGGTKFIENVTNKRYEWPIALSASTARSIAERMLVEDDLNYRKGGIVLGPRLARLTPGTVLLINIGGADVHVEITSISENADLQREVGVHEIRPEIYIESATTQGVEPYSTLDRNGAIVRPSAQSPIMFPVPPPAYQLTSQAVTGTAVLVVGVDDGAPVFSPKDIYVRNGSGVARKVATVSSRAQTGIVAVTPVATVSSFSTDRDSVLTITFDSTEAISLLSNATTDVLYADLTRNMLMVGAELIQYHTFELQGDGRTVIFRNLLRGLRNTDYAVDNHVVGETAGVYTAQNTALIQIDIVDELSSLVSIGAVSSGAAESSVAYFTMPIVAANRKSPAPFTVRRSQIPSNSRALFNVYHRGHVQNNIINNDNIQINGGNFGKTFIAVLAGPYDDAQFKVSLASFHAEYTAAVASGSYNLQFVPSNSAYVKRYIEGAFSLAAPYGWEFLYDRSLQNADGVDAILGASAFYFAAFTLDDLSTTVPGYDYVGHTQAFYYSAGEIAPSTNASAGDYAHMVVDTHNGL